MKALLKASMAQMNKDYGIPLPVPLPTLAPYDMKILHGQVNTAIGSSGK